MGLLSKLLTGIGLKKLLNKLVKLVLPWLIRRGFNIVWKAVDNELMPDAREAVRKAGRQFSAKGRALVEKGKIEAEEWEEGEKRMETLNNEFWLGANEDD